jgi:hypothetical protein
MSRFINTKGQPTLGIGICQRCQTKRRLADLVEDGNIKGFRVCDPIQWPSRGCWDTYDPWRLPAPPPDRLNLPFVRPDTDVTIYPDGLPPIQPAMPLPPGVSLDVNGFRVTENGSPRMTSDGALRVVNFVPDAPSVSSFLFVVTEEGLSMTTEGGIPLVIGTGESNG